MTNFNPELYNFAHFQYIKSPTWDFQQLRNGISEGGRTEEVELLLSYNH